MKKTVFICLALAFGSLSFAQKQFFKPEKLVETGVYYYPEAWNPDQWDRDFKKMAEMGFEFTHMAEFAWAQLEPTEGNYDFKWIDKAVELAAKYNLKVIMCTPVATPPVWLTKKYPEVLVQLPNGQLAQHGTREHYSWSSPKYQELSKKVVEAMAKHYANDKRIWGWQIDNEPSHYGTLDYNPAAQASFRAWLKKKYQTIDALNKAWGTPFWSGVYSDFEQIELPNEGRLISGVASPTSLIDMKRFNADECAMFISLQCKILKDNVAKSQFVTTNFMNGHTDVDPWRNPDLDFISYTVYPVAGYTEGVGDQGFRMGDPWRISFANDFFRSLKGVTGVMELQPGQVNWGSYNPQPYPGAVRMWLWNAFAGGLDFICSYRFRQPLYGGEQFHYGMVGTDGVTPLNGGQQYSQFISEIRDLRKQYVPNAAMPKEYAARKAAMVYNMDNVWETTIQPQTFQWNERNHIAKYYNSLKLLTAPVEIVSETKDLSAYPVVVVAAYQMVDKELVEKWYKYAENGGQLVVSVRTGLKDHNGHFFESPWADIISKLIGGKIVMNDMLGGNKTAKVSFGGKDYSWNNWGDMLEPAAGTQVWATFADQFYAGKPTVIHRKLGKGSVTYIGTDTDDGKLEKDVLKKVYETAGIAVNELPEGVMVNWRDGFFIANNYSSSNVTLDIPATAKILVGTKEMVPAGVLVWK
ncbi:MAG: beta-galactosidase [Paludibacter sp.]